MSFQRMTAMSARAAVLGLILVCSSGCDVVFQGASARASDEWRRTYPLSPGGSVEVINRNGSIDVEASSAPGVEVRAERTARGVTNEAAQQLLKQAEIIEQAAPDRIRLETRPMPGMFGMSRVEVRYTLRVPATCAVRVTTTNGGITVVGLQGAVNAETTNGTLTGRGLSGTIEGSTTNGRISVEVETIAQQGLRLETTNGGIELRLPPAARADIAARVTNGSIDASGLNVQREDTSSRRRFEGRLNGGGPRVDLETTNGSIRVLGKS
jgi:hypothetical protein